MWVRYHSLGIFSPSLQRVATLPWRLLHWSMRQPCCHPQNTGTVSRHLGAASVSEHTSQGQTLCCYGDEKRMHWWYYTAVLDLVGVSLVLRHSNHPAYAHKNWKGRISKCYMMYNRTYLHLNQDFFLSPDTMAVAWRKTSLESGSNRASCSTSSRLGRLANMYMCPLTNSSNCCTAEVNCRDA